MVTLFLILYILTEVYRIEKYCIVTKYRDTYRIVSTVYRYTSTSWLDDELEHWQVRKGPVLRL